MPRHDDHGTDGAGGLAPAVRPALSLALAALSALVILGVTTRIVLNYGDYARRNFDAEFLRGREGDFAGPYPWAFYPHILVGPITLLLGLLLLAERAGGTYPGAHRALGRVQAALVLGVLTPSGIAMAFRPAAGPVAGLGLLGLAAATAATMAIGVREARARRFVGHRRWLWRNYVLLTSAVVLRLVGGLGTVLGVSAFWFDPLAVWLSWLVPLAALECLQGRRLAPRVRSATAVDVSRRPGSSPHRGS